MRSPGNFWPVIWLLGMIFAGAEAPGYGDRMSHGADEAVRTHEEKDVSLQSFHEKSRPSMFSLRRNCSREQGRIVHATLYCQSLLPKVVRSELTKKLKDCTSWCSLPKRWSPFSPSCHVNLKEDQEKGGDGTKRWRKCLLRANLSEADGRQTCFSVITCRRSMNCNFCCKNSEYNQWFELSLPDKETVRTGNTHANTENMFCCFSANISRHEQSAGNIRCCLLTKHAFRGSRSVCLPLALFGEMPRKKLAKRNLPSRALVSPQLPGAILQRKFHRERGSETNQERAVFYRAHSPMAHNQQTGRSGSIRQQRHLLSKRQSTGWSGAAGRWEGSGGSEVTGDWIYGSSDEEQAASGSGHLPIGWYWGDEEDEADNWTLYISQESSSSITVTKAPSDSDHELTKGVTERTIGEQEQNSQIVAHSNVSQQTRHSEESGTNGSTLLITQGTSLIAPILFSLAIAVTV